VIDLVIRVLDVFNDRASRLASMLIMPMLLIVFAVVVLRYGFSMGFIWMQDSYVWLNSIIFTCMVGGTLLHDRHVRVEVLYSLMSIRKRAWVNTIGVLTLLWPTAIVIAMNGYAPVLRSWSLLETSPNMGGLPFAYLHKSFVLLFCGLLFSQGLSLLLRSLRLLTRYDSIGKGD